MIEREYNSKLCWTADQRLIFGQMDGAKIDYLAKNKPVGGIWCHSLLMFCTIVYELMLQLL